MTGAIAAIAEPPQIPVPGVDEAARLPVQSKCFSDQCAEAKARCQGKYHNRQGKSSDRQHRADIQARTEQNNRKFQDLLRCKFNSRRCHAVRLVKGIHNHTDKHGDDRCPDKVQSGALLQAFQEFRRSGNHQRNRRSGNQFLCVFHNNNFLQMYRFFFLSPKPIRIFYHV